MFSLRSVSSMHSSPRFVGLSARPSRLPLSHRWIGQSTAPVDRRRSAPSQHSLVIHSRTHPISHRSGRSQRSRPRYRRALPSPSGMPSDGRKVSERRGGPAVLTSLRVNVGPLNFSKRKLGRRDAAGFKKLPHPDDFLLWQIAMSVRECSRTSIEHHADSVAGLIVHFCPQEMYEFFESTFTLSR